MDQNRQLTKELKKQAQREEWQRQYEEQKASGLKACEWCILAPF